MRPLVTTLLAALVATGAASAQTYPVKPIRLVVPYAPGGSSDVIGRALAPRLGELLGQPLVIDNRAGAGSMLGTDVVAKSPADGYTLLLADMPHTIVPAVYGARVPYDPVAGFEPISVIGVAPMMLFVAAASKARTLAEYVALAKASPGKITIASGGNGSATHLMAELIQKHAGIALVHIPYKGAGPAVTDTVAGQVDSTFTTPATATGHLRSGKLRALAVTAPARLPDYADVPTFGESGVANMVIQHWWGLLAPAGVPRPIVAQLNDALQRTLAASDVRERLAAVGVRDAPQSGPAALAAVIASDLARWKAIVSEANIRAE